MRSIPIRTYWILLYLTITVLSAALSSPDYFVSLSIYERTLIGSLLGILLWELSIVDIQKMHVPVKLSYTGILLGLVSTLSLASSIGFWQSLLLAKSRAITALVALLLTETLCRTSEKLFNKIVLGIGDAKVVAMGAAWIGGSGICIAMTLAFTLAGVFSIVGRIIGKLKPLQAFPFVPFTAIGIWAVWLFGTNWWFNLWQNLWGI